MMSNMKSKASNLHITSGKGFHLSFDNGYTLSIQIGPSNYCDNYGGFDKWDATPAAEYSLESTTFEAAIINSGGKLIPFPGNEQDTVKGYVDMSELPELITLVSNL
jgi:hypothetical protein